MKRVDGGWLIWIQGGLLRAQRFNPDMQELIGEPMTLADPVEYDQVTQAGGFSASDGEIGRAHV